MRRIFDQFWSKRRIGGAKKNEHAQQADPNNVAGVEKSKTWNTTVTRVESWPEEARPLKQHTWATFFFLVGDVIIVLAPVFFILLGAAAVTLHKQPTKDNAFGEKVEFAIDLGPTIFPIVFAAVIGRSMKMIARYLAERGAKLSTLELLMASQSVWGTVESQILMRRLTFVGANLLFLWSMSPLGGQASLRLLDKTIARNETSTPLRYMSTGPASASWSVSAVLPQAGTNQIDPLYAASLLAPNQVKQGSQDTWGNVKVPNLEQLNPGTQGDGWIDVPSNFTSPTSYYALVGVPVIGLPNDRDAQFNLESSHLTVDCGAFTEMPLPENVYSENENNTFGSKLIEAVPGAMTAEDILQSTTFFLQTTTPWKPGEDGRIEGFFGFINESMVDVPFQKRIITYASKFNGTLNVANCSVAQTHVETDIVCRSGSCFANRIRKSLSDNRPSEFTALDHHLIGREVLKGFPSNFRGQTGSSPTEQFIYDTSTFPFVSPISGFLYGDNPGWVNLSSLPLQTFSERLAVVLNTYYQLSLAPNAFLGNLPATNLSVYGPDTLPGSDLEVYLPGNISSLNSTYLNWWSTFDNEVHNMDLSFIGATTNATFSKGREVYVCDFAWLSLLFSASAIIFMTGVASLILKGRTLAPEMFGFVSSMTYENPWIKIPQGGTMLDAMERARLLKDVKVYIGDVRGNADEGHIALAAGVPLRRLERGRSYL